MRHFMLAAAMAGLPLPAWAGAAATELQGRGAQIYQCGPAKGGFGWRFVAPEAGLFDAAGNPAGRHFAGPSWQARDGSLVVGEVVSASAAPAPGAVPWLLLRAKSHAGAGAFANVGFIVRIDTHGGAAPAAGCDAAHAGTQLRVPYSAGYVFLGG